MSGGMPELGSKISLISKADIRYEGRLFTVDPQECTIALANVRSFGTEDRETTCSIAPQSQIYDYILFRGTDIKDIRVVNNGLPHPNDPAIMQMQLPNGHVVPHFPMQPINTPMTNYSNPFGGMGGIGSAGIPTGTFGLNKSKQPSEFNDAIPESTITNQSVVDHKDQVSVLDLITGASRSTTPVSLMSRKSPSADMAVQVNQTVRDNTQKRQGNGQQRNNQTGNTGSGLGGGGNQRVPRDSGKMPDQQHHNQQHQNFDRNYQRNPMQNNQNRGWINRGNNRNNRGRGRIQGPNQGNFRQMGGNLNKGRPKSTIKFDQDYDFEQANNQFEELRSQLTKLKVGDEVKPEQVNGEVDKKDDSGNETGAGEHEQEEEEVVIGYDKSKSFFDNISCEAATDRTKGKNRTDWRQERKLNTETFGVSSTRRGNFSYRPRGGYYNHRNMNMRGNYRNYRPGNYRPRNTRNPQNNGMPNKNNANQQQQNTQQNPETNQQQPQQQPPQPIAVAAAGK